MSNKLKFGLLGALGYIAPRHIQAINNISADLKCVSDLDFNSAQKKEFLSKNIETLNDLEEMIEYHKKDSYAQYSNVGTHKDDLIFHIKEYPIKKFGSQGQQKSFIIALRLAQFDWLKVQKKTNPILLLDDIFDKLDAKRVQKLVTLVTQDYFGQVMVSDTDEDRMKALLNSLNVPSKLFEVVKGDVTEISR